jgi:hypothetical protein
VSGTHAAVHGFRWFGRKLTHTDVGLMGRGACVSNGFGSSSVVGVEVVLGWCSNEDGEGQWNSKGIFVSIFISLF